MHFSWFVMSKNIDYVIPPFWSYQGVPLCCAFRRLHGIGRVFRNSSPMRSDLEFPVASCEQNLQLQKATIWENISVAVSKHQTSKSHVNHQIPTFTALLSCFFAKSGIFEFVTGKSSNNNLDLWSLGSPTRSMKWETKNHKQKTLTGCLIW